MNKYHILQKELYVKGSGSMKCFGNSMLPLLSSGTTCYFNNEVSYEVGDIVFCKVKGRFIDAHIIKKIAPGPVYLIANRAGYENGWTRIIYGRVVKAINKNNHTEFQAKSRPRTDE